MKVSKDYNGIRFQISEQFECAIPFDELIENCKFAFYSKHKTLNYSTPVLHFEDSFLASRFDVDIEAHKEFPLNCIGIKYRNDGLRTSSNFSLGDGPIIDQHSITKDAPALIADFLKKEGCDEFIYNKKRQRDLAFPLKREFA
jgi:hypothetical protein